MHNRAVHPIVTIACRYLLLIATAAMFLLHLVSAPLLRRGVRGVTLLRWEAVYYALLLAGLVLPAFRRVTIAAVILGTLHVAAWIYTEREKPVVPGERLLMAVRVFDAGEAIVLAWIALLLAGAI